MPDHPRRLLWRTLVRPYGKRTSSQLPSPEYGGTSISTDTACAALAYLGHRVVGIGTSEALAPRESIYIPV